MSVKPSLQALWLADEVTLDPETGKVSVSDMFDQIEIRRPATDFVAPACLFFALRDVHGEVELTLSYTDLSTNEVLLERPVKLSHDDPLLTLDVVLNIPKIPVPHEGEYSWDLFWGGEMIGCSRIAASVSQ